MSIADELEKLANLRDKGTLNEEEFKEQKKRVIGKILPSTNMKDDLNSKKEDNPSTNTSSAANNKDIIISMLFIFVCIYGVWKIGAYAYNKFFSSSAGIANYGENNITIAEDGTVIQDVSWDNSYKDKILEKVMEHCQAILQLAWMNLKVFNYFSIEPFSYQIVILNKEAFQLTGLS